MRAAVGKVGRVRKLYPDGDVKVEVAGRSWVFAVEAVERLVSMASLMHHMNDPAGVAESAAHVAELMQMLRDADSSAPLNPPQPPPGVSSSDGPTSSCTALRAAALSSSSFALLSETGAGAAASSSSSSSRAAASAPAAHRKTLTLSSNAYEESMRAGWREALVACVGRGDADRTRALLSQLAFELEPHKDAGPSCSSSSSSSGSGGGRSSAPISSADLNVLVNGQGAIHIASQNGFLEILQLLLEHRADIELEDKYEHALHTITRLLITCSC